MSKIIPAMAVRTSQWCQTTLGEFVRLQRGHDLTDETRRFGHVPVMGAAGMNGYHDIARAKGPGVVIGRSGASFGKAHYCPQDYWPHNTGLYVTDFQGNDPRFTYYFLKSLDFSGYNSGSAQPSLNRNFIYRIPVCVPDPIEQRAIAGVLGALDDKIELNRRMNETLEALAHTLFQKMIQEGGKEVPFADSIEILGGGTPKTSVGDYWNGEIPWFSVVDAPSESDVFVIDTEKKITQAGIENSSTQVLPVGTTIISARGTVGKVALVGVPMAMNQSCYGLRGKADDSGYYTYFQTRAVVGELQQHAHGSVFDTITRDTLAGVDVPTPDPEIVTEFEKKVAPLMKRILNNLHESQTLTALRDALLPKLLSGAVRVKENKN